MAEPDRTVERIGLLADVDARRVLTNEHDNQVYLEVPGDEPATVSTLVGELEDAGWISEPDDSVVWELTDAGRAALDAGPAALIDEGEGLLT